MQTPDYNNLFAGIFSMGAGIGHVIQTHQVSAADAQNVLGGIQVGLQAFHVDLPPFVTQGLFPILLQAASAFGQQQALAGAPAPAPVYPAGTVGAFLNSKPQ